METCNKFSKTPIKKSKHYFQEWKYIINVSKPQGEMIFCPFPSKAENCSLIILNKGIPKENKKWEISCYGAHPRNKCLGKLKDFYFIKLT